MFKIQRMLKLIFFQISDLTFVASELKILFLQCSNGIFGPSECCF